MAISIALGVITAACAVAGVVNQTKARKSGEKIANAQLEVEKKAAAVQSATALTIAQSHELSNILTSSDETMTALNIAALGHAFDSQTAMNVAAIQAQGEKEAQGAANNAKILFIMAGTAGVLSIGFLLARKKT